MRGKEPAEAKPMDRRTSHHTKKVRFTVKKSMSSNMIFSDVLDMPRSPFNIAANEFWSVGFLLCFQNRSFSVSTQSDKAVPFDGCFETNRSLP